MNPSPKLKAHHLTRHALVYIRQSSPKQVQHNTESTRRQYQLAELAHQWGWPQPLITTIDEDLGLSGAESTHRVGFQRLVASISLGEVGLVLVTEVSRISRLDSDWHRVIELCAVFETLIADEDGLYDPRDPNDRLVLGLKGTLFSAELHILQARMRGNLLNKARRGELAVRLPVGYRRLHDGNVVLDPDEQVRQTLQVIFEQFTLLKSARAVQRYFYAHHLQMPRLIQQGLDYNQLIWVKPTYQMIQQVLTNPAYAGVFVFGRRRQQVLPGDPPKHQAHRLPLEEWDIVIPDIYPAYLTYDQYLANRKLLQANTYSFAKKNPGAPREGPGLLQGILICGRCGRHMTPTYGECPTYCCQRERLTYAQPACQSFSMRHLDQALSESFLEAMQPVRLETTLEALAVLERERHSLEHQWQLRLERSQYQVRLAQRQYDAVDPDNRLVARELETRWNEALLALQQLEQEFAQARHTELAPLTETDQQAVRQLAEDLPAVWKATTTTHRDRKRLLRVVISTVTLTAHPETRSAEFSILWSGGITTQHVVTCPPQGWHCITKPEVVQRIREMALYLPDHKIAAELNAAGMQTQTGKAWTYLRVQSIRKLYDIPTACPVDAAARVRGDGLMSVKMAAEKLNVSPSLINLWAKHGVLASDQRTPDSYRWVRLSEADQARVNGSWDSSHLPTISEVMNQRQLLREAVWDLVRSGDYLVYRARKGQSWEWRLECVPSSVLANSPQPIVSDEKGRVQYE